MLPAQLPQGLVVDQREKVRPRVVKELVRYGHPGTVHRFHEIPGLMKGQRFFSNCGVTTRSNLVRVQIPESEVGAYLVHDVADLSSDRQQIRHQPHAVALRHVEQDGSHDVDDIWRRSCPPLAVVAQVPPTPPLARSQRGAEARICRCVEFRLNLMKAVTSDDRFSAIKIETFTG